MQLLNGKVKINFKALFSRKNEKTVETVDNEEKTKEEVKE